MRKVVTIYSDESYLRQKSKLVTFKEKRLSGYIRDLREYCMKNEVFAMAAIQLHINKRIVYLKNTDLNKIEDKEHNENRLLINPVVTKKEELTSYWEACASCLDNMGLVYRPYKIEVCYFDELGNKHTDIFTDFEATVLSHELDHLDGILHMDIAKEILVMNREDRKKHRETHLYEIISKNKDYTLLKEEYNDTTRRKES